MDFSQAFIEACHTLKLNGEVKYSLPVEGDLVEDKTAAIDPAIVSCNGGASLQGTQALLERLSSFWR